MDEDEAGRPDFDPDILSFLSALEVTADGGGKGIDTFLIGEVIFTYHWHCVGLR